MDDLQPLRKLLREKGFGEPRKSKHGLYLNAYRRMPYTNDDMDPYTIHVSINLCSPHEFSLSLYQISYDGRRRRTPHYHYTIDWKTKGFQFEFTDAADAVERAGELIDAAILMVEGRFKRHDEWRESPEGQMFEGLSPAESLNLTLRLMRERRATK